METLSSTLLEAELGRLAEAIRKLQAESIAKVPAAKAAMGYNPPRAGTWVVGAIYEIAQAFGAPAARETAEGKRAVGALRKLLELRGEAEQLARTVGYIERGYAGLAWQPALHRGSPNGRRNS